MYNDIMLDSCNNGPHYILYLDFMVGRLKVQRTPDVYHHMSQIKYICLVTSQVVLPAALPEWMNACCRISVMAIHDLPVLCYIFMQLCFYGQPGESCCGLRKTGVSMSENMFDLGLNLEC